MTIYVQPSLHFGARLLKRAKDVDGGRLLVIPRKGRLPQRYVALEPDVTLVDRFSPHAARKRDHGQPVSEVVIDSRLKRWINASKDSIHGRKLSPRHPSIQAWQRFKQSRFDAARQQ